MRSPSVSMLAAVLTLSSLASPIRQEPAAARVDHPMVRLDVVVSGPGGAAIATLQRSDFELREGGFQRRPDSVEFRSFTRGDPSRRAFAFFLDEFHVRPGVNADLVRRTVADFIDEKLDPDDLVTVVKSSDSVKSLRFTRDRALVHGLIDNFTGRKTDDDPARDRTSRATLREIAERMGALAPDRPVIVIFSEGFARDEDSSTTRITDLGAVLRLASRFHQSIYTFNPEPSGAGPAAETLTWLATQTGGRASKAERFLHGVARLFHDSEGYYALHYRPIALDGAFHGVEVRQKHPHADVLSPAGYWALRDTDWQEVTALSSPNTAIVTRELRRSPLIDTWIGVERNASAGEQVTVTWEPGQSSGVRPDSVRVTARGARGETLFQGQIAAVDDRTGPHPDKARFLVAPGRVEVDIALLDDRGKTVDTTARDFDVPEFRPSARPGPILLTPQIIRTRNRDGTNVASESGASSPLATRTFRRTDRLVVLVPAFDPGGETVRITARLLNRVGGPMGTLVPVGDPTRHDVSVFALPLTSLSAGEYAIDLQGSTSRGTAAERLSFRVTW